MLLSRVPAVHAWPTTTKSSLMVRSERSSRLEPRGSGTRAKGRRQTPQDDMRLHEPCATARWLPAPIAFGRPRLYPKVASRGRPPVAPLHDGSALTHQEPAITPDLVAAHGLKPDEYARFVAL